jgi:hypothetical protein
MSLNGLDKAILLSISYSNVFSFPLTSREVWLRLITKKEVTLQKVEQSLIKLTQKKILKKFGKYYTVVEKDLSRLRLKREIYSKEKLTEANGLVSKAKLIPFIKAIVVTGSLSVSNAKKNDDTDWLIITSKNTLWITRPLIIMIASFYGKRRERSGNHRDNSWCFNMFMTDDSVSISREKRNVYTSYEVCQAKFVYDKGGVERKFLKDNSWVKNYLFNFYSSRVFEVKKKTLDFKENDKNSFFIRYINDILYFIQYLYMKSRITREVVEKNKAFFHPRDTHGKISKQWKQILINKVKKS